MSDTERMGSALTTIGLPVALGIIMFGLGLALTPRDFARVGRHPKAVIVALLCQLLVLPALLRNGVGFVAALGLCCLLTTILFAAMTWALGRFGITL